MFVARSYREHEAGSCSPPRSPPLARHTSASLAASVSTAAAYAARTRLSASRSPDVCLASAAGVLRSLDMLRSARLEESGHHARPAHHRERTCSCPDQETVFSVVDALTTEVLSQQELIRSLLHRLARYEPVPLAAELSRRDGAASMLASGSNATHRAASSADGLPPRGEPEGSLPAQLLSPIRQEPDSPARVVAAGEGGSSPGVRSEPIPAAQREGRGSPSPSPSSSFASMAAAARRRAAAAAAAAAVPARAEPIPSPQDQEPVAGAGSSVGALEESTGGGDAAGTGTAASAGDEDSDAALTRVSHELLTAGLRPTAAVAPSPAPHRLRATPTGTAPVRHYMP